MKTYQAGIDVGSTTVKLVVLDENGQMIFGQYQRHLSHTQRALSDLLKQARAALGECALELRATGSGAINLAKALGIPFVQEVVAVAQALERVAPQVDVAIELGGEDAKIIYFKGGLEERMNGVCAGGTGSFIDQMAALLQTDASGLDREAAHYQQIYPIAARCGVFAKTDIQPLINEGATKADLAASIFQAVVNQTISGLACGKPIRGHVAFLGGPLHFLPQLKAAFIRTLKLTDETTIDPENSHLFAATGAAIDETPAEAQPLSALIKRLDSGVQMDFELKRLPVLFEDEADKMQDFIEQTWKDINTVYYAACKKNHRKWVMCEAKMSFLRLFQNLLLYVVLIYMVLNKGMSISDFVLYIGLVASFSTAMTDMFCNMVWMNMNRMELDDFRTFMDWNEDKPDIEKGQGVSKNIGLKQFEFKFENVSFKYPGHEKYVLKNINLTIEAGSKLAVVGINGAGKTTLTKLLMRLYEPTEGRILLNGVDVKKYDRDTYFKIFAPVFQNIEIFAFPVWQNISMKPENETDKNRTMEALEKSGLDEKINKYENKIDTMLLRIFDPNGVDLSGGERQRLAMARALYQNREVLVLDEPTAALDALAEDRMYQEFNQMVKGKTAIFISHRLSSTRFCDKIVMFEDGRIIEEGTHEQLINANGKYRNMFQVQAQYYKDKEGEVC